MKKDTQEKFFNDTTVITILVGLLVIGTGILLYKEAKQPQPIIVSSKIAPSKPLPKTGKVVVKPIPNYDGNYKVVS